MSDLTVIASRQNQLAIGNQNLLEVEAQLDLDDSLEMGSRNNDSSSITESIVALDMNELEQELVRLRNENRMWRDCCKVTTAAFSVVVIILVAFLIVK